MRTRAIGKAWFESWDEDDALDHEYLVGHPGGGLGAWIRDNYEEGGDGYPGFTVFLRDADGKLLSFKIEIELEPVFIVYDPTTVEEGESGK